MKIISLQPSPVVDNIVEGRELTRLPYPFHVTESGDVERQDFWRGDPAAVLGFQDKVDVQRINVWWADVVADPQRAVGKYPVMRTAAGQIYTYTVAIESVAVTQED